MAILKNSDRELTVENNTSIIDAAELLGASFGCQNGTCGTCLTIITNGASNLNAPTPSEEQFGLDDNERLLCQCEIKDGEVTIDV